jgi:hypothetical protein
MLAELTISVFYAPFLSKAQEHRYGPESNSLSVYDRDAPGSPPRRLTFTQRSFRRQEPKNINDFLNSCRRNRCGRLSKEILIDGFNRVVIDALAGLRGN